MAPDEMRWAFNQIMTSLFRVSMMNGYRMRDGSPLDWKNWTNKLNSTDTAYEMQGVLRQLMMNLHAQTDNDFSMKRLTAERIKEYVDKHYHNYTLTVTEIAAYTGLSINYTRQIFKDIYGISISDYILDKKIEKAKELLLNTNDTAKQIAEKVGYPDNRYFYVVFKKKTGETADSFRRKKGSISKNN